MQADVTVVICTYNRAGVYLDKMIKSVQNQTYKDIKILIYDNASTDGTDRFIESYLKEDDRMSYFCNKINTKNLQTEEYMKKRKIWAENISDMSIGDCPRIFDLSKGVRSIADLVDTEYVICVHDDDYLHADMIRTEVEQLEKEKSIVAVSCQVEKIDCDGKRIENDDEETGYVYQKMEYCKAFLSGENFKLIRVPTMMIRTSVYKEIYKKCDCYNDIGMFFELNKIGGIRILDNKLYYRRIHSAQDSFDRYYLNYVHRYYDIPHLYELCSEEEYRALEKKHDELLYVSKKIKVIFDHLKNHDEANKLYKKYEAVSNMTKYDMIEEKVFLFIIEMLYVLENQKKNVKEYVIWGAGSAGCKTKFIMDNLFSEYKCVGFIDPFKQGNQEDVKIYSPDNYQFDKKQVVVVSTTVAAAEVSKILEDKSYQIFDEYWFGYGVG